MKKIFILRGVPGSGKSSWVKEKQLEPYTISSDNVRLLFRGPVQDLQGYRTISQEDNLRVWKFIRERVEERMLRGELIILDSTMCKLNNLSAYTELAGRYGYEMYIIDFMGLVTLEECIERNKVRPEVARVPEQVIRDMYASYKAEHNYPRNCKVIDPREFAGIVTRYNKVDAKQYKKVVFIGDIHGCYNPLKEYFASNPFTEDNLYVFLGDYIDRGLQNAEVLNFLLNIYKKSNVILLEGNHEIHLKQYVAKGYKEYKFDSTEDMEIVKKYVGSNAVKEYLAKNIKSSEFIENTIPQIACLKKSQLRDLCSKLVTNVLITYDDNTFTVTHGGVDYGVVTPEIQAIKGVGSYGDLPELYKAWSRDYHDKKAWLVHGHRNVQGYPIYNENLRVINLCDTIEAGGYLRVAELIYNQGEIEVTPKMIKNDLYKSKDYKGDIFDQLCNNPYIYKKELGGDLVSFNFTSKAFYKQAWDEMTTKARGLFVDMKERKVAARSFNKFFNYGETEDTNDTGREKNLTFPAQVYQKENGFLGIVSWYKGKLLVCSKSQNQGPFADMFREKLIETLGNEGIDELRYYLQHNDVSLVFECIDHKKDRHIVYYNDSKVVLLEGFANTLEEDTLPYSELCALAKRLDCPVKKQVRTLETLHELQDFILEVAINKADVTEGYVIEGANHFRFKLKTPFYNYWKRLRSYLYRIQKGEKTFGPTGNKEMDSIIMFMLSLPPGAICRMDIIDVKNAFEINEKLEENGWKWIDLQ